MNGILQGLPFIFVYIDDIFVTSRDQEEHLDHLKVVFQHLQDHRLIIHVEKCQFNCSSAWADFTSAWKGPTSA